MTKYLVYDTCGLNPLGVYDTESEAEEAAAILEENGVNTVIVKNDDYEQA